MWLWDWLCGLFGHPVWGGARRSPQWGKVRDMVLEDATCAACGTGNGLEVHHIEPFHVRPDLELEPSNLIPLCKHCHFVFGHLGCWRCHNPLVSMDASKHRGRVCEFRGEHHGKAD
jgi:5-methylcytosine-specific restriction enzyme A